MGKAKNARAELRPQALIGVDDVELSSAWYQRLLDCETGHGGDEYERLLKDGELVLQLHKWNDGSDDHENLDRDDTKPCGAGVWLYFETDAFDATLKRIRKLKIEVIDAPPLLGEQGGREVCVRDPDGYHVVIANSKRARQT